MIHAEHILYNLSVKEKIAQLLFLDLRDYPPIPEHITHALESFGCGGIIVYHGELGDARKAIASCQKKSRIPLIVSADFERGLGQILKGALEYPHNMALGATANPLYAQKQASYVARESQELGVNMLFAPVLDLNTQPENPIINVRAYGDDPVKVSDFGCAYVLGLESAGVAACVKHFPGHGDTRVDSHISLPRVNLRAESFYHHHCLPFRKAIREQVSAVMLAHAFCPHLYQEGVPAPFSKTLVSYILQELFGFHGLVVSDALNMGALTEKFSQGKILVSMFRAGVDVLLYPESYSLALKTLENAVAEGLVSVKRLNKSVRKILMLKEKLGLFRVAKYYKPRKENLGFSAEALVSGDSCRDSAADLAAVIAEHSITLLSRKSVSEDFSAQLYAQCAAFFPLQNNVPVDLCVLDEDALEGRTELFVEILSAGFADSCAVLSSVQSFSPEILPQKKLVFPAENVVLLVVFSSVAAGKASVSLSNGLRKALREISLNSARVILCLCASPYLLVNAPVKLALLAYSDSLYSQRALVDVLCGKISPQGKLPVKVLHASA